MEPKSAAIPFSEFDTRATSDDIRVRPRPDRRRPQRHDDLAGRLDSLCLLDECVAAGWLWSEPGGLYSLTHLT